MSRDILRGLDEIGVEVASATFELSGLPSLDVRVAAAHETMRAQPRAAQG
jgi:hypothetical protein